MELYAGIDLHANNSWVAVLDDRHETVLSRRVDNELGEIVGLLSPYREELVGVVVESTWNWYWLVDGLRDEGFVVNLAHPGAMKQYEGLKFVGDRHDARHLARTRALGILPEGYIYPKEDRGLRDLTRRRKTLVEHRSSMLTSMKGAFECRTGIRIKSDELRQMSAEAILARIEDPHAAAAVSCFLEPVRALDLQIRKIERYLLKHARKRPGLEILKTAPGIGDVLALTILYEVGQIDRFPQVGNFASYCRLVKSDWTSDNKRKGSGNVRNGNPYLSWAFSEVAHFAVRYSPEAKRFYDRKRAAKNGMVANRALAHKMARSVYHMLKKGEPFDPDKAFA